jgi:hypothetical protein
MFQPSRLENSNKTFASVLKSNQTIRIFGKPLGQFEQFQGEKSFLPVPRVEPRFKFSIQILNREEFVLIASQIF